MLLPSPSNQFWEDLQSNRLYKVDKQSGTQSPIRRDHSPKPSFNTKITGRANYAQRIDSQQQGLIPKIPQYLKRHDEIYEKYQRQPIKKLSVRSNLQKKYPTGEPQQNVISLIESTIENTAKNNKIQFIRKYSYNSTDVSSPTQPNTVAFDQKQFFKLTQYHSGVSEQKYNFSSNPESNEYLKPIGVHNYRLVSKKAFKKQQLINQLQSQCFKNPMQCSTPNRFPKKSNPRNDWKLDLNDSTVLQQSLHRSNTKVPQVSPTKFERKKAERKQRLFMQQLILKAQDRKISRQYRSLLSKL